MVVFSLFRYCCWCLFLLLFVFDVCLFLFSCCLCGVSVFVSFVWGMLVCCLFCFCYTTCVVCVLVLLCWRFVVDNLIECFVVCVFGCLCMFVFCLLCSCSWVVMLCCCL